jgi:hypothetical protein
MDSKEVILVGKGNKLDVYIPGRSTTENANNFIHDQLVNINHKGKSPIVLWNVRPWDNFNIIHAIYTQKLIHLQRLGFNCQLILYDKLVEKICRFKNPNEIEQVKNNVERNIKWFQKSGLDIDKTEFLLESFLWEKINFNDFSNKITFFAQICDIKISEIKIDEIFDRFWELYYEEAVNCDFILTGDKDKTDIWGMFRKKIVDTNHFNYTPPTILVFPQFKGLKNNEVTPENSSFLISTNDDPTEIYKKINSSNKNFIKYVIDFFILPFLNNMVIFREKEKYYSNYNEMTKDLSINDIKSICVNELKDYFKKINDE